MLHLGGHSTGGVVPDCSLKSGMVDQYEHRALCQTPFFLPLTYVQLQELVKQKMNNAASVC